MARMPKSLPKQRITPETLRDGLRLLLPGYAPALTPDEEKALMIPLLPDNDREP
jgi:hypothetical protein